MDIEQHEDVEVSDMRENMPYTRGYMIIGTSQMFYGSQRLLECQNATDCKKILKMTEISIEPT